MIVYRATNQITGRVYIGVASCSLARRRTGHFRSARDGSPAIFHNSIRKHGIEAFLFEELERCSDRAALLEREIYWIRQLGSRHPAGYNMTDGGDGWNQPHSEVSREKMRQSQQAARARETEEQKRKRAASISAAKKGIPQPKIAAAVKKRHLDKLAELERLRHEHPDRVFTYFKK
jgi:group I intron endonuclease